MRRYIVALLVVTVSIARAMKAQGATRQVGTRACGPGWMPNGKMGIDGSISAIVYPYDAKRELPSEYEHFVGQALRENLHVPQPLVLDTYEYLPMYHPGDTVPFARAFASIWSAYRIVLHQDGHLTDVKAVGGVRNRALDSSVVSALVTVDTLQLIPPVARSTHLGQDGLELRITIRAWRSDSLPPHAVVEPLFRMRIPLFDVDSAPSKVPNQDSPLYPYAARQASVDGDVMAMFVIEASGSVDRTSIQFLSTTALPFAESALQSLMETKFVPMRIAGCAVRTVTRMPFVYRINR